MSSEQFERTLKERFSQAEIPPPPQLWDRIEAGMASSRGKKRGFLWLWWSIAALVLFSAGVLWIYIPSESLQQPISHQSRPSVEAIQETDGSEPSTEAGLTSTQPGQDVRLPSENSPPVNADPVAVPSLPPVSSLEHEPVLQALQPVAKNGTMPSQPDSLHPSMSNPDQHSSSVSNESLSIGRVKEMESKAEQLNTSPGLPLTGTSPQHKARRWRFDVSAAQLFALGYDRALSGMNTSGIQALNADYAGYTNRSQFSASPGAQIATVRFPRSYQSISMEAGRMISARWSLSLGLEAGIGQGGQASLGLLEEDAGLMVGIPLDSSGVIQVEQSRIQITGLEPFQHLYLRMPMSVNLVIPAGRGYFEQGLGVGLNYGRVRIPEQIGEELASEPEEFSSPGSPDPTPVLVPSKFFTDLRFRSRYVQPLGHNTEVFGGLILQSTLTPSFRGDAAIEQRPLRAGIEFGIRFR